MVVLQHEHLLSLIDMNPKYPQDEEVYDDEEDLIITQAFKCLCDHCHQEITYYHKYYYKCDQCDYSLHKLCGEVPIMLQHPSHNAHSLTLFQDKLQGECEICKSTSQFNKLQYHCSRCMFNICLDCAMGEVQYHTIYHPSHQHPLNPGCKHKQILAECDACGMEHKGVFYECSICFRSLIHNDCVFQPKRLLIQHSTFGRVFHTHPLILSYSFPRVHQQEKFYPTCRVCDNSFINAEDLWVYKCEKCRYYVHLKCANLKYESSDSGTADTSKIKHHEDDSTIILRLPFFDQTQNMFTKLFTRETNAKSIAHESHQHPLVLGDTMSKVQDLCDGCLRPIMDKTFYKCNTYECDFVLHELCTRLPSTLDKTCPAKHDLYLNQEAIRPNAFCRVCNHFCKGFFYSCLRCKYKYTVDVSCALLIGTITHKSHPDHPLSRAETRLFKDYCRMCLSGFRSKEESSFSCDICNFHLHRECALLLPETIRHRYDRHPLTLSYSPVENHEGDYFCEVCEEELNPYISFYHCHECAQSLHSACAQLKPLPESYNLYGLSEKGGSENTYPNKFHDHPLSFVHGINYDLHGCSECHLNLTEDFVLKCLKCNYAMHADHLNERYHSKYVDTVSTREYPYHKHPLRLSRHMGARSVRCLDAWCRYQINRDEYVFACSKCRSAIHAYHFHRNEHEKKLRYIPSF